VNLTWQKSSSVLSIVRAPYMGPQGHRQNKSVRETNLLVRSLEMKNRTKGQVGASYSLTEGG
jgi:hypothetical protein